jgi:uncharacterized hydantoinase/oxoprolinase family protein
LCPVAAELFSTTLDVYLLLDRLAEDPADMQTPNGRPATVAAAHDRVARMVCCDRTEFTLDDARSAARAFAAAQLETLAGAFGKVVDGHPPPYAGAIVSGSGSFLARELLGRNRATSLCPVISLDEQLSPAVATAACAYAIAVLATERL